MMLGTTNIKLKLRPNRKWNDGIKMDLNKTGSGGVGLIHLAQNGVQWRVFVNVVLSLSI